MSIELFLKDPEATFTMGKKIGNKLNPGDVVCLYGDLGTGKTYITKGIASALGINETITSPTFTKVQEYDGNIKLFHFDVYKVLDEEEMYFLGFDDYLIQNAIIIIEWANNIKNILPKNRIDITLKYHEEGRLINIDFKGIDNLNFESEAE